MTLMQDIITIGGVQYRHYYMSDYKYIVVTESVESGEEPKPTKYIDALLRVDSELPPITVEATNESFPNDRYKEIPGYVVHLLDGKFYSTVLVLGTSNPNIIYLAEDVRTDLLALANIDTYTFFYRDAEDIARQVEQKIDDALNTYYQLHVEELNEAKGELEGSISNVNTALTASIDTLSNDLNTAKLETKDYIDNNYVPQTQKATLDNFGICKPDGTTISIQDGTLSVSVSGKCMGEIVTSPIPLDSPGLKLLNGPTILEDGIYTDFVRYVKRVYNSANSRMMYCYSLNNVYVFIREETPTASGLAYNDVGIVLGTYKLSSSSKTSIEFTSYTPNITSGTYSKYASGNRVLTPRPNCFTTSANWNSYKSKFGTCGKFVLGSQEVTKYYAWGDNATDSGSSSVTLDNPDDSNNQEEPFTPASNPVVITEKESPQVGDTVYLYATKRPWGTVKSFDPDTQKIVFNEYNIDLDTELTRCNVTFDIKEDVSCVKLPYLSGIIEGTLSNNNLGNATEAGLPNIKGTFQGAGDYAETPTATGAFQRYKKGVSVRNNDGDADWVYSFDASRSSEVYGKSSKVQPQTIKVFYYIVVANAITSSASIDLDSIVSELESKADVSMITSLQASIDYCTTNVNNVLTVVDSKVDKTDLQDVVVVIETSPRSLLPSWYRVWSDGWCEQGGIATTSNGFGNVGPFAKTFLNTNYTAIVSQCYGGTAVTPSPGEAYKNADIVSIDSFTTSGFRILHCTNADTPTSGTVSWIVSGYIA